MRKFDIGTQNDSRYQKPERGNVIHVLSNKYNICVNILLLGGFNPKILFQYNQKTEFEIS